MHQSVILMTKPIPKPDAHKSERDPRTVDPKQTHTGRKHQYWQQHEAPPIIEQQ